MRTNIHPPGVAGESILHLLTAVLPLLTLALLPTLAYAETAVQAWVQLYDSSRISEDLASSVAVDEDGNVVVTGSAGTEVVRVDCATVKYTSAGIPLWTNRYPECAGVAVAIDRGRDVIVAGTMENDFVTIKYSSVGAPRWTNIYNGFGNSVDYAVAVAVDSSNNVIVTGAATGVGTSLDYGIVKYSSNGTVLWSKSYNGTGNDRDMPTALALDSMNNIIVIGGSGGIGNSFDYATIKYSSSGTLLWAKRYDGPGHALDNAKAVALDSNDDVIVTGYSANAAGGYNYATIKYSSAGVPLWTNRYNAPTTGDDRAYAVAVDASNNVIVAGAAFVAGSGYNYGTIKYSSAGVPLWTNRYSGTASAVAVDRAGNVCVAGYSSNDFALLRYSSAGVPLSTNRYKGPWGSIPPTPTCAMVLDRCGSAILAGTTGNYPRYDYATIKYSFPPVLAIVRLPDAAVQLLVSNVQPGSVVIEASTNLMGWKPICTNTTSTNAFSYTDPITDNSSLRFYRAFQSP